MGNPEPMEYPSQKGSPCGVWEAQPPSKMKVSNREGCVNTKCLIKRVATFVVRDILLTCYCCKCRVQCTIVHSLHIGKPSLYLSLQ